MEIQLLQVSDFAFIPSLLLWQTAIKAKKCLNGDLSQLVRDRREIPSNSSRHAPGKLMSLFARWNCAGQFRATGYLSIVAFYHELAFIAPMLFKS